MIILIKLIVFLVQKLHRHRTVLNFCVSDTVIKLLSCLILLRIFQDSPKKYHINSGSEKAALPHFHAVSLLTLK